jgi:ParB-like chromosome segregation protein Spo0J
MILAPATPQLNVVYKSITLLAPYPYNARTHSKAQIRKIAESIRSFGFTNPVLIDGDNTIVAGHGRVDAARLLGIEQVPTILLDTLTKQQIRAYVIADNRLALDASWDPSILKIELQNLVFENEIDISLTGFEVGEIDLIVNAQDPACDGADNIPEEQPITVTRLGDLWQLGEHRVLCGDARAESALVTLMGGLQASVIFSDPPTMWP